MAVYQLIYTSSKRGYGVFSQSSEIKPDESRQITINTAYKRPQSLITSNETNYKKYPVNLSRFRLSNQKWVMSQSSYVGLDNTGRQGNFFTHALVFPSIKDFNKKFLYYPYRTELTDEEKELTNPSLLPQVGDFEVSNESTFSFARANSSKLALFVQCFLDAQRGRKKLGIDDKNENIILWIQFLYDVLPYKLLEEVEFTTYTDRITSAFDIVGIYDPTIVKDSSRFIIFDGKENTKDISPFAKAITADYLSNRSRDLFYFFSNSMKREELLQKIDTLYSTLNTSNVSIDDVFSLIRNLPKKDLSISTEVIRFLLNSDYLLKFDDSQVQFILGLIEPSENTSEYLNLIHKIAFEAKKSTLDLMIQTIKGNNKLFQDFAEKSTNDNINYFLLSMRIKHESSPFNKERFHEILKIAKLISTSKREWLITPANQLVDQLIMTFPRNDGIHSESDLKSMLDKIKAIASNEVLQDRVAYRFQNEMQQMDGINQLAVRNSTLIFALRGESKALVSILRRYDSKEDQPRLLNVLETIYNTLGESVTEDNTLMTQYKTLYPLYEQAFYHLSYSKQQKFVRRYRRVFGNKSQLHFRPNYPLFALLGVLVLALLGTSTYLVIDSRPTLTYLEKEYSALFTPKVINDELIQIYENTPENLIIEIANSLMESPTLSNSGVFEKPPTFNERRNRVEFKIGGGNFLSPTFAIGFEKISSESSPEIFIGDSLVEPGEVISFNLNYSEIYSGDVIEVLANIIPDLQIKDSTFNTYSKIEVLNSAETIASEINPLINEEFLKYIEIDSTLLEEFDKSRAFSEVSTHDVKLSIKNHAGNSTVINLRLNIDSSVIPIKESINYYGDTSFLKISNNSLWLTILKDFMTSLNIDLSGVRLSIPEFSPTRDFVYLFDTSGTIRFEIPMSAIAKDIKPTIQFSNTESNTIEFDWNGLTEDELLNKIYQEIGEVIVEDSGVVFLLEDELYSPYLGNYKGVDINRQSLVQFDHPTLSLSPPDTSSVFTALGEDVDSFEVKIIVISGHGVSSDPLNVRIKRPTE